MQNFEAAEAGLRRLEALANQHPQGQRGALGDISVMAQRAQVDWSVAQGQLELAAVQLAPLLDICLSRGDQRLTAHLQLQLAVVEHGCKRFTRAQELIESALRLGHRLGLMRSLLDVDPSAFELVRAASAAPGFDPLLRFFVDRLGAAAKAEAAVAPAAAQAPKKASAQSAAKVLETLSERETEVMRLLIQALSNKRIARTLNLSPETVKWHLRNAYGKLGVTGRDDAVERFRDLEGQGSTPPPA